MKSKLSFSYRKGTFLPQRFWVAIKKFISNLLKILIYSLIFDLLRLNMKDSKLKLKAFVRSVLLSESFFVLLVFPILNVNCTHFQILRTTSKSERKGKVFFILQKPPISQNIFLKQSNIRWNLI